MSTAWFPDPDILAIEDTFSPLNRLYSDGHCPNLQDVVPELSH